MDIISYNKAASVQKDLNNRVLTDVPENAVFTDTTYSNLSEFTNDVGYLTSYTETDPIFSAWDKSTGIVITESQISDFGSYEPSDNTILKDADIGVTLQAYDANTVIDPSYVHTDNNYTTAEKTKLSGIESGATADQTPTEILTALKTVDGSGSGLDAELWEGNSFSTYLNQPVLTTSSPTFSAPRASNRLSVGTTSPRVNSINTIELAGGTSSFLMGVQDGSGRVQMRWNASTGVSPTYLVSNEPSARYEIVDVTQPADALWRIDYAAAGTAGDTISYSNVLSLGTSVFSYNGNTVWTAGNDGSGSGLDADLLDGVQGSNYLRSDIDDTHNADLTVNRLVTDKIVDTSKRVLNYDFSINPNSAIGDLDGYFDVGEVVELFSFEPTGSSQNYYVEGTVKIQSSFSVQTLFIRSAVRSNFLPDLSVSSTYDHYTATGHDVAYPVWWLDKSVSGTAKLMLKFTGSNIHDIEASFKVFQRSDYGEALTVVAEHKVDTLPTNYVESVITRNHSTHNGNITFRDNTIWHSGNDGSGSGLDADTLDGIQGSQVVRNDQNNTINGNLTITGTVDGRDIATDGTKLDGIASGAQVNTVTSVAGKTGAVTLTKSNVGLSNVDNTSDLAKPISTATQTALNSKLNSSNPVISGTPTEADYVLTGSVLNPSNGSIQYLNMTGNVTLTESLSNGQGITLLVDGGATYVLTLPTVTWITTKGNVAPTLVGTKDVLEFWKQQGVLYVAYTGNAGNI